MKIILSESQYKILLENTPIDIHKIHMQYGYSIFDVLNKIDYSSYYDLYRGFSEEDDEEDKNYMYDDQKVIIDEIDNMFWIFDNLPDPIPIYRTIQVKRIDDIDKEDLGDYWSYNRDSAIGFAENHGNGNVLLSGFISKTHVNWKRTINAYINFTIDAFTSGEQEEEITIDNSDYITDLKSEYIEDED